MHVDRRRVLAYRALVQGLHADGEVAAGLSVLDLGVQDTPPGSAAHAISIRLETGVGRGTDHDLVTTWSTRGAPHVHRRADLVAMSRALWPWSDADALARLDTSSSPVRASGLPAREALRLVADNIADIVTEPMAKGDVSTALTPRVPEAMTVDCRRCEATHIVETLFRSAVLPAGIVFDPDERVVTFVPVPGWPGIPDDAVGADRLMRSYLGLLGPAAPADVAAFLGSTRAEVEGRWPDGLVEVAVDDKAVWIPEASLDALASAPDPPTVRMLPPSDPWLQARDRDLVVPDREHQKAIWPILGRPGVVLVRGDVAATWRSRKKGRRLEVTVTPFGRIAASVRRGIADQADLAAHTKGLTEATVTVA